MKDIVNLLGNLVTAVRQHVEDDVENTEKCEYERCADFVDEQYRKVSEVAVAQMEMLEKENPDRKTCAIAHGGGSCVTIASISENYVDGFAIREHITKTITPVSNIEKQCVEVMYRVENNAL